MLCSFIQSGPNPTPSACCARCGGLIIGRHLCETRAGQRFTVPYCNVLYKVTSRALVPCDNNSVGWDPPPHRSPTSLHYSFIDTHTHTLPSSTSAQFGIRHFVVDSTWDDEVERFEKE